MIYVVKEKHLNDFKQVHCVKPKDLYSRLGHRQPNLDFDSQDEVVPMNMDKIHSIEYMENFDRMMQESHNSDNSSYGTSEQGENSDS